MKNHNRLFKDFNEYQSEHSLANELPYWEFIDDLAVLSDGTLCSGFRVNGVSIETWDFERINRLTQDLRSILNGLSDGCELTFALEMNSDYFSLIEAHETLKGENPNVRWVADARIDALEAELKSETLLKPNLYLFVYNRLGRTTAEEGLGVRILFPLAKSLPTGETRTVRQDEKGSRPNSASLKRFTWVHWH